MDTRAGPDARRHLARAARRRLRRRAAARAARPGARARARWPSAPAATAVAAIGFSVLQFLLGVDAPVSLLLVRQILLVIVLNTLLALPVYAVVPPRARAVPARRPAPPPPPRVHDRRPEPAEPRVDRRHAVADRGAPPADHAAARGARRRARRHRVRAVRDRLLPPLVPAGADGRRLRQPGAREPRAQDQDRGAARATSSTATAACSSRRAPRRWCRSCRTRCRTPSCRWPTLPAGAAPRPRARASRRRASCARSSARLRADGRKLDAGREAPAAPAARARRARRPVRDRPPIPAGEAELRVALPAARHGDRAAPRDDPPRVVVEGIADRRTPNVTIKTDVAAAGVQLPARAPRGRSRASWSRSSTCATTRTRRSAPSCSARCARSRPSELKQQALPRRRPRARGSARTASRRPTTSTCAARDGYTRVVVNALGNRDDTRRTTRTRPDPGPPAAPDARPRAPARGATTRCERAIDAAHCNGNPAKAGAYVAMDPRNGEVLALGSYPSFDANLFAKPISQATYERAQLARRTARRCSTARSRPAIRPARPSSRSPRSPRSRAGSSRRARSINDTGVFQLGGREFQNARRRASTARSTLPRALQVSSDVFFYTARRARPTTAGAVIQDWARRLGFGTPHRASTSRASSAASCPTAKWRDGGFAKYLQVRQAARTSTIGPTAALFACGGIERGWSGGDNVNLAVGQGDLQATPLQMAIAYSAIANGGTRRHAAPRHAGRGRRRAASSRRSASRRGAGSSIDPGDAGRDPRRPAGRRRGAPAAPRPTSSRASRYRSTARPARRSAPPNPDQSWYACYVARPGQADRRRGDGREGRLRRRGRRARRAADPLEVVRGADSEFHAGTSATR